MDATGKPLRRQAQGLQCHYFSVIQYQGFRLAPRQGTTTSVQPSSEPGGI
ncbi:hypothetical protein GE21DRAFT_1220572 [Neurospora crassa]|uniref:Uncharacterized protein n=1 Tax=Neurospora tetrasperma (strain FGSC 2508 / ATCC MYA-4615 / P0657) TaxID=510951 RepID=F8MM69_NEUT8|nr:uncharacterized protein NEUTE1DRAFT_100641 [Neurospora tetrasperma FGSC 2508]EGO57743.1 hypothetical protein NEUTE1DRAFT_100641 [Neurospora tetrasperma FGSC 2508]EGZ71985.1 hypothetical protein NEUTE2DRAFT_65561 [Neurospora tetrasperma FGSC 2509]KHE79568.1 hypothetical protein GE21DRAFT_1220572 [Neurospora crassa]